MRNLIIMAVAAIALSGCLSSADVRPDGPLDYGTYTTQEEAVAIATRNLKSRAKDPASLIIECGYVSRNWTSNRISRRSFIAGYFLDCSANGKNSFGAYAGARNYRFVMRNGSVVRVLEGDSQGNYLPEGMADMLRNL